MSDLPGYDAWKRRLPVEPYCDDEDCTCTSERRDPDAAYEEKRERDWDRDLDEREGGWE
jgi:hypothetical protein